MSAPDLPPPHRDPFERRDDSFVVGVVDEDDHSTRPVFLRSENGYRDVESGGVSERRGSSSGPSDPDELEGNGDVRIDDDDPSYFVVGFKVVLDEGDHWMNRLATWGTGRAAYDPRIRFSGQISHAEILVRASDDDASSEWVRYSILKRKGVVGRDEVTGKRTIRWVPASVHGVVTTLNAVNNYRFYRVNTTRGNVRKARAFLENERLKESGFNLLGYLFNFAFPFKFGLRHAREAKRREKNRWFCTELVVCAMQVAGVDAVLPLRACAVSPNDLHAFMERHGVGRHVPSTTFLR